MKLAIGIDPGASGSVALFDGTTLQIFDMPVVEVKRGIRKVRQTDAAMLSVALESAGKRFYDANPKELAALQWGEGFHAFVERVGAMPGQGVSSMFAFGRAAGVIEGVLAGLGIATELVSPQVWQVAMGVKGKGKDGAREMAAKIYPASAHLFARKKDDGRADAALIAAYGWWHKAQHGPCWMAALGDADRYVEECLIAEERKAA